MGHERKNAECPLIAITMGDPGGIGAEVIVKALADPEVRERGRFVIFGLDEMLGYAADQAEINPFWFRVPHEEFEQVRSGVVVADFDEVAATRSFTREPTAEGGLASLRVLDEAVQAQ
jgi:4-hydroxythreonine-4-phosphate dehydrogenase